MAFVERLCEALVDDYLTCGKLKSCGKVERRRAFIEINDKVN